MGIFDHYNHLRLTQDQETAVQKVAAFLDGPSQVFMLKGYAGSGKTTILKGLVEYLRALEKDFMLMAPTGRAAKVIRERTGEQAFTIHKSIYTYEELVEVKQGDSFYYYYKIRNNTDVVNKVFIIDEASMLSDAKSEGEFFRFGTSHLLSDLITYSRVTSPTAKTKLIFVGDPCQLPPVGDNSSKVFDIEYLKQKFQVLCEETEMKEVKRHDNASKILERASRIRKSFSTGFFNDFNLFPDGKEIVKLSPDEFLKTWESSASPKIMIASKNKTCLDLNVQIRERKFGQAELPIQKTDIVILGSNNYRKGVFNGEFAVVNEAGSSKISRTIPLRGQGPVTLHWRDVELVFPDADSEKVVKGKLLENFLYGDNYLRPEETQALYVDFTKRHKTLKPGTEEFKEAIIEDEYFNPLMLKYGYAVTCHKAQGGEWDNVFSVWDHENKKEFDYLKDQQLRKSKDNEQFYRWAYTAITRASKTLYTLNPPSFSSYSSIAFVGTDVMAALSGLQGKNLQTEQVELSDDLLQQLNSYNLLQEPIEIQDHFIQIRHAVRKHFIEVALWRKTNYEVLYQFQRENKTAGLKTWVNEKRKLKGTWLEHPPLTNDKGFCKEVEQILKTLPNIFVKRNTVETILGKIEFDYSIEQQFPFTKDLFDDLQIIFQDTEISITAIDHQQYKERYTFQRQSETVLIDFEYNLSGVFGRVLPVGKASNSPLVIDVVNKLHELKNTEHAR